MPRKNCFFFYTLFLILFSLAQYEVRAFDHVQKFDKCNVKKREQSCYSQLTVKGGSVMTGNCSLLRGIRMLHNWHLFITLRCHQSLFCV